jgi:hypothetical protein
MNEAYALRNQAPCLRLKHLNWRLGLAKARGDELATLEITRIIKNEAKKRRQRRINGYVKDPRGRAILRVTVQSQDGDTTYDTRHEVEEQVQQNLQARFSLGKRASINEGALLQDFGTLADTEAATRLFHGDYDFPPGCDAATIGLLREAARLRLEYDNLPTVSTDITTKEYLDFWSTAKETTSSSKSGRHFGHYKAVCSHPDLVRIHVTSINLAVKRGDPLVRWRNGVTVLLEKVAGNTCIDKLRAICLLEADFNWWLKVVFAKRMMARMHSHGMIPLEQGAVRGKMATDTSMMKQLFFDQANILHEDCSITSTDAANCYDAGNHTATSLSLQAMGVGLNFILCYLVCIQLMRYYLQTGYGLSDTSYGGSPDAICMGLVQGSGAAPGVWIAVSTVILGAYKAEGYGASITSGWSGKEISLSALLYVDDTDLLHKPQYKTDSLGALVSWVQQATNFWAHLLQATGGSLKPTKCYWYILSYKFTAGTASLLSSQELSNLSLCIPQPGSGHVVIELKDPSHATKVLGVWCSPSGDGMPMLMHMMGKGHQWAKKVLASTLSPQEVWFSFNTQAIMAVRYGLVPLMATRCQIDQALNKWYRQCLPALGINRNIRKEWKMLPLQFQGLGLPNLSLEKLADSLKLLQQHWGYNSDLGTALRYSFELIQMETGLSGNFLLRDYYSLGCLATHSWFKCLWELITYYRVRVLLADDMIVPPLREGDKVVMELALCILPSSHWVSFNRARKYFHVYHMSQLLLSDGKTVDPTALSLGHHRTTSYKFPIESPTSQDITIWCATIKAITSSALVLSPPLGKFLRPCNESHTWQADISTKTLIHHLSSGKYEVYKPVICSVHTRRNIRFSYRYSTVRPPITSLAASITPNPDGSVSLHSTTSLPTVPPSETTSFLSQLQVGTQASLWKSIFIEEGGDWIPTAARNCSLVMVHDGSYMPDLDPSICSAAVVVTCTKSGRVGRIQICEKTDAISASNYRAEIIGGLLASHILRTLDSLITGGTTGVQLYCDNLGVVHHAHHPFRTLSERQAQADVLSVFVNNLRNTTIKWEYQHVYGHLDDHIPFAALSLPQQLNVIADGLAKDAITNAIKTQRYCQPEYPRETIRVYCDGRKVTSSFRQALYKSWGSRIARDLFHDKKIIPSQYFHLVNWEALHRVMHTLPQMYRVWLTKHVSGFCGTNKQLSRMSSSMDNKCMCCGGKNEDKLHITRCPDPGRTTLFTQTVLELIEWMTKSNSDRELILALQAYLIQRGKKPMKRICATMPHLHTMAHDCDRLGWENFTEGRICNSLFQVQQSWLTKTGFQRSITTWSRRFICKVLNITHRQWLYRNARIHIKVSEGLTQPAHDTIMSRVSTLMGTDPLELLPCHRQLLDWDFEELGQGSTVDRQYWIANMESALQASRKKRGIEETGTTLEDGRGRRTRSRN